MTEKELEKIYNEGYRAVYWTAMALLKNEADAEDVVQDTFISFIEHYGNLEDTSKVVALLKKIAANKCLTRLKSVRTTNVEDEVLENLETVPEDFLPDSIVESAETRKIVMDIIENSLSEEVRRTIILFYFNEMSTKEIAEALGVPQGTVLWRLNYARKKIKKEVEKYEEESNTKLFGMPLPFLTKLFTKEAEQVPIKPMPASLLRLSASAEAASSEAGKQIAAEAIKKGTGIMSKKIIIGCASALAVGALAGIIALNINNTSDKKEEKSRKETTEVTTEEAYGKDVEESIDLTEESEKEESTSETTAEPTEETTTETTVYTNAGKPNPSGTIFLAFDGKNREEIIENIIEISQTPADTTLENFPDRCTVYPNDLKFQEDGVNWVFYFWELDSLGNAGGFDEIDIHIIRNDDGTLDPGSRASLLIVAPDRDTWEEYYSTSCEALMRILGRDSLMTLGSGDSESSLHMTYFVSKLIDERGRFTLDIDIPLVDPAEAVEEDNDV
ncbi:MAG: sigma-70 family RNA polymerase sigma factor [Clostridiales bacterium]|nr:sigma-70 family RNA polymerase sigma factor [Clostridiales bacterium]